METEAGIKKKKKRKVTSHPQRETRALARAQTSGGQLSVQLLSFGLISLPPPSFSPFLRTTTIPTRSQLSGIFRDDVVIRSEWNRHEVQSQEIVRVQ